MHINKTITIIIFFIIPAANAITLMNDTFSTDSIANDSWVEINQDAGSDAIIQNGILNMTMSSGYAHTGTSVYLNQSLSQNGEYTIKFQVYLGSWASAYAGDNGIFFLDDACYSVTDCRDTIYYGSPTGHALFYDIGKGCAFANHGTGILADNDRTTWHCGWEFGVLNDTAILTEGSWYNFTIKINWTNNETNVSVNNTLRANTTLSTTYTTAVGNPFMLELHFSNYPYAAMRYVMIDNFVLEYTSTLTSPCPSSVAGDWHITNYIYCENTTTPYLVVCGGYCGDVYLDTGGYLELNGTRVLSRHLFLKGGNAKLWNRGNFLLWTAPGCYPLC